MVVNSDTKGSRSGNRVDIVKSAPHPGPKDSCPVWRLYEKRCHSEKGRLLGFSGKSTVWS